MIKNRNEFCQEAQVVDNKGREWNLWIARVGEKGLRWIWYNEDSKTLLYLLWWGEAGPEDGSDGTKGIGPAGQITPTKTGAL